MMNFQAVCLLLVFISLGRTHADNPCGDWAPYKDKKCLKILQESGQLTYQDAGNICSENDSHLLIINGANEQNFLQKLIKTNNIADNIWIGLKYSDDTYQWSDGSKLRFSKLETANLLNDSNYCVQVATTGDWVEKPCSTKNLAICEKIQPWSLTKLQAKLMALEEDPLPVGFVYVQLPHEKSPEDIWPSLDWKDISSKYEGVFFRVKGGNAAAFGEEQAEDSPRLVAMQVLEKPANESYTSFNVKADGEPSKALSIRGDPEYFTGWNMEVTVSKAEVRPRNMAVKIWKRVQA